MVKVYLNTSPDTKFFDYEKYKIARNFSDSENFVHKGDYDKCYEFKDNELFNCHLDTIYYVLNNQKPDDYKYRSLSVGDLIERDGILYYVDDFGFKTVSWYKRDDYTEMIEGLMGWMEENDND